MQKARNVRHQERQPKNRSGLKMLTMEGKMPPRLAVAAGEKRAVHGVILAKMGHILITLKRVFCRSKISFKRLVI